MKILKKIKINFTDFWPGFNPKDNYFYNLLEQEFTVEISNNPDYLFYSVFGNSHQKFNNIKISYIGENIAPVFRDQDPLGSDYSFSFDQIDDSRNYRLPHYLLYGGYYDLINKKVDDLLINRKFCNFVASNPNCQDRNLFVQELSKYKKVDSGGRWMNNIGYPVSDKRKFQSDYKFSIAFENNAYRPGYSWYITEKVMEPMTVNSIPLYKGGDKIGNDFNTKSFVNFHDFSTMGDMIDFIIELDKNDDKYLDMLRQPWFDNNQIPENNKIENIKNFLFNIFK